jgi:hypothetical protein
MVALQWLQMGQRFSAPGLDKILKFRKSLQVKTLYILPGCRLYFFKRGAGVPPLAGGNAPTSPLN